MNQVIEFAQKLIAAGATYYTLEEALGGQEVNISPQLQQIVKILFAPLNLEKYYFEVSQTQPQPYYLSR